MAFGSSYCSESALVLVTTEGSCQGLKFSVGPGRVRSACRFTVEQVLSALHYTKTTTPTGLGSARMFGHLLAVHR